MQKKKRFEKQNLDEKEYENIEKGVRIGKTIITLGGVFALGKKNRSRFIKECQENIQIIQKPVYYTDWFFFCSTNVSGSGLPAAYSWSALTPVSPRTTRASCAHQ